MTVQITVGPDIEEKRMRRIVEGIRIRNRVSRGGVVKALLLCVALEIFYLYLTLYEPVWWREDRRYIPYLAHVSACLMPFIVAWGIWTMPTTRGGFEKRLQERRRKR
ncbi:hypothetical protein [Celeribacter persicus]|uniref:hypothetical protein n=1 Tax=Celeribacter persicus TaxID=1651082 RepID=UPI0011B20808|nr:hypothetical protein [Celeribacter persicus]